jgi:hypothetical protein
MREDFHGEFLAVLQELIRPHPDASRGAGQDRRAGRQSCSAREEADQLRNVEYQIAIGELVPDLKTHPRILLDTAILHFQSVSVAPDL